VRVECLCVGLLFENSTVYRKSVLYFFPVHLLSAPFGVLVVGVGFL
jgi:hypothetical protein